MAFNNLMIQLVCEARGLLVNAPTAIEFGNQTFRAKGNKLEEARRFLARCGTAPDASELAAIEEAYRRGERDRLTERFFKAIGFAGYDSIDVNSVHGSLIMDLNENLRSRYGFERRFDLVTNNGTGEHIFDQAAVFRNAHELTEPGGIMIHCLPCNNYINHGFYQFSPLFFMDLAAVNDYDILKITVGASSGEQTGFISRDLPAIFPLDGPRLSLNDLLQRVSDRHLMRYLVGCLDNVLGRKPGKGPFILERAVRGISRRHPKSLVSAILRKRGAGAFRKPIQGRYGGENIEIDDLRESYRASGTR